MESTFTATAVNADNTFALRRPCAGNLVYNGGFAEGLAGWLHDNVSVLPCRFAHSGSSAAGMGVRCNNHSALLAQHIRLPQTETPLFLQLTFHLAGARAHPAALDVKLVWLDEIGTALGAGVSTVVPQWAIGAGACGIWNSYSFVTSQAPDQACFAELRFLKLPGCDSGNFLVIDDVLLTLVPAACAWRDHPLSEMQALEGPMDWPHGHGNEPRRRPYPEPLTTWPGTAGGPPDLPGPCGCCCSCTCCCRGFRSVPEWSAHRHWKQQW